MTHDQKKALTAYLTGFISEARKKRLEDVLSERTSHIRIVLENLYQAHNASAVLRSCDCFGIQHVHFIENRNSLRISDEVAMGSSNWLSVHRHRDQQANTTRALSELRDMGYRIIATSPHNEDVMIHDLPVDQKFALVFGTEIDGITDEVRKSADAFVRIPMYGFTESFNISVSAALCMYELTGRLRRSGISYTLSEDEKRDIMLEWLQASVEHGPALTRRFLSEQ